MMRWPFILTSLLLPGALACAGEEAGFASSTRTEITSDSALRSRQDSIARAQPGYVVDSILPIAEQLRRFREGLPEVRVFADGAPTHEALVRAITDGVARADTAALRRLTVNRAEYAWLVYPTSVHARGPLQQAPQITWHMLVMRNRIGLSRLLARLGGQVGDIVSHRCEAVTAGARMRDAVTCVARRRGDDGVFRDGRLLGALVERGGAWKVMSWENDF